MTKQTTTTAKQLTDLNASAKTAPATDAVEAAPAVLTKAQADRLGKVEACFTAEAGALEGALKASNDTRLGLLLLAESKPVFDLVWSRLAAHPYFAARTVAGGGSKAGESVLKSTIKRYFKLSALDLKAPAVEGLAGWDRYSRDALTPIIRDAEGKGKSAAGRTPRAGGKATSAGQKLDTSNGPSMVGKEINVDTFLAARGGASIADVIAMINDIKANVDKKSALILLAEAEDIFADLQKMGLK